MRRCRRGKATLRASHGGPALAPPTAGMRPADDRLRRRKNKKAHRSGP